MQTKENDGNFLFVCVFLYPCKIEGYHIVA